MSAQDEFDRAVKEYALAEKRGDEFLRALLKATERTMKVQQACKCDDNNPVHPIKFAETKAKLGEAIAAATGAIDALAEAHRLGDKACEPVIGPAGGGGGKTINFKDLETVDTCLKTRQRHFMA